MVKKIDEKVINELSSYGIPIPEGLIEEFCDEFIDYGKFFDGKDKKKLIAGIKEATKTPTGRMAFWTTFEDIVKQQQKDPKFKLKLDMNSVYSGYGYVAEREPNKIHINSDYIQNLYKDENLPPKEIENLINFERAATFFHEAQHTRQLRTSAFSGQYLVSDAATQALSRQIALEHPSETYRDMHNISPAERKNWEKAVDYDPKTQKYNPYKAAMYSKTMQPRYTEDIINPTKGNPNINYGTLYTSWLYAKSDILYADFDSIDRKFYSQMPLASRPTSRMSDGAQEYLKNRNNTIVERDVDFLKQLAKITRPYSDEFKKHCTEKDFDAFITALNEDSDLKREDFSSDEAYNAAYNYQYVIDDLDYCFSQISYYSTQIHGNPDAADKKKWINESAKGLKYLKDNYGIVLTKTNKNNERIAQTEPTTGQGLSGALALSGDDITQENAKTDSTQRSIAPQQNTRLT